MTPYATAGALAIVMTLTGVASAEPMAYRADPSRSRLFVMVFKDPSALAAKLSHDHVVRAHGFTGEVRWDPAAPETCAVSVTVPVAKLDPDPPALRRRVGLKRMLSDGDRAQVKTHLLSQDQLWGERFPHIRFEAATCVPKRDGFAVVGKLTLRGVTRPVKATMKIGVDRETGELSASGSLALRHTWFGFSPYSALGGALRNQDEMRLVIVMRASPTTP